MPSRIRFLLVLPPRILLIVLLGGGLTSCFSQARKTLIPSDVQTIHIQNGAAPGAQKLTFTTAQSIDTILTFYRDRLPEHGWIFSCSTAVPDTGCSSNITSRVEIAHDVYHRQGDTERRGPTFEVIIEQETPPTTLVEVFDQTK